MRIARPRPEQNGERQELGWETQGVPPGAYYLVARICDGVNPPTMVRSSHPITLVPPVLQVQNLSPRETLRYELALLKGSSPAPLTSVKASTASGSADWPAAGGSFKVLLPLARGANAVSLTAAGVEHVFQLTYQPQTNPRFVRLVYVLAQDGDGRFDAPAGEPNDVASAVARIRLGGRLIQTATAEMLAAQGLGRRTFELERDEAGEPRVELSRSSLTLAQARSMEGLALWQHFYEKALAHTALGGGRLALFGSGNLHTWAPSLDEVAARWSDTREIDTQLLFDDSGGRRTYWANYAGGLGATLHELGHCLSLPHPRNRQGVMYLDFHRLNRLFLPVEPPSRTSSGLNPVTPMDEATWDRSSAVRLRFHRWLVQDNPTLQNLTPSIQIVGSNLEVASAVGIRHITYNLSGEVETHDEFLGTPRPRVVTPVAELKARLRGATTCRVTAIDDHGNIAERDLSLP